MSDDFPVRVEQRGTVAVWTLDRPDRLNALTRPTAPRPRQARARGGHERLRARRRPHRRRRQGLLRGGRSQGAPGDVGRRRPGHARPLPRRARAHRPLPEARRRGAERGCAGRRPRARARVRPARGHGGRPARSPRDVASASSPVLAARSASRVSSGRRGPRR